MRHLVVVLSATVLAGLGVYAVLESAGLLALSMQDWLIMRPATFVGTLASTGAIAAALALLLMRALRRAESASFAALEERVGRLEAGRGDPLR